MAISAGERRFPLGGGGVEGRAGRQRLATYEPMYDQEPRPARAAEPLPDDETELKLRGQPDALKAIFAGPAICGKATGRGSSRRLRTSTTTPPINGCGRAGSPSGCAGTAAAMFRRSSPGMSAGWSPTAANGRRPWAPPTPTSACCPRRRARSWTGWSRRATCARCSRPGCAGRPAGSRPPATAVRRA